MTDEGVERIGGFLGLYKQVRDEITRSALLHTGVVGGSPEVYEKIRESGRGAVSLFASAPGTYSYITSASGLDRRHWHNHDIEVSFDDAGRARIIARFARTGAKVVLFGVQTGV